MARLLLVEEGEMLGPSLVDITGNGWSCHRAQWNSFAFESLDHRTADLIVAGIAWNQRRSLDFLQWLRNHPARSPTLAVFPEETARGSLHSYFDVVDDFIILPTRPEELRHRIGRLLPSTQQPELSQVRDRLSGELGLANLIGKHSAFLAELAKIPRAASSDSEVLITGETGTGKALCARAIHHMSRRRNFPLICVDCGGLPDQLFENEMFGHVRGAFTDAHRTQKGLVAMAEGGTLFLDEIDSLSMPAQTKLLRFLQDHSYRALGAEKFDRADVRIIAATNRDLEQAVAEKSFRRDLFFRINVLRMHMVPLRQRADDIELLVQHFLKLCCAETGGPQKTLCPSTLRLLRGLEWPGNVRELYNMVRRAVLFSEGGRLLPSHFLSQAHGNEVEASLAFRDARDRAIHTFERQYVEDLLRRHAGNITRAARDAKQDRRAFGRLVKRHGIDPRSL
jgi:DNA-binding NtrC family response regulator